MYYLCNKAVHKGRDTIVLLIWKLMWTFRKNAFHSDFIKIIPLQL